MGRKKRSVRLGVAVATVALAGGIGLVAAPAGAQPQTKALNCKAKDYRLLFWANGHPAIPAIGFQDFPVPHMELYVGKGKQYPDNQIVLFTRAGAGNNSQVCTTATSAPKPGSIKSAKTQTDAALLTCKLKKVVVEFGADATSSAVRLFQSGKPVADATLGTTPSLKYNKTVCKAGKPPS